MSIRKVLAVGYFDRDLDPGPDEHGMTTGADDFGRLRIVIAATATLAGALGFSLAAHLLDRAGRAVPRDTACEDGAPRH